MRNAYLLLFLVPGDRDLWRGPYCTHSSKIQNLRAFGNAHSKGQLPAARTVSQSRRVVDVGDTVELPVGFSVDEGGFDLAEKRARIEILDHLRGEKIHVYKYKPKKDYRKKTGHRQELTRVKVLEVSDGS